MYHWQTGRRPIKKIPRWAWAILSAVYIMSVYLMIMHTAQKTLSGNPPGDMPVIVAVGVRESCWVSEKMAKRTGNDLRPMGVWRQGVTG